MSLFVSMLALGLVTGFHCVMMCGNLVLTYAMKGNEEGTFLQRMKPHLAYHGAKILSYTLVGAVLGALGVFISAQARSWVSVLAGAYMVLLGLGMTPWFPWLRKLSPRPPKFFMQMLMKIRKKAVADAAEGDASLLTPLAFGLMTGLMPCGPLQAAQLKAAAAGNPVLGALAMLGFGLGTMPLMLGYGAAASYLNKKLGKIMPYVAAAFIVILGFIMVNRGAMALGSPVTFNTVKSAVIGQQGVAVDESKFKKGSDGVIEIPVTVDASHGGYSPSTLAVPAGKPFRLIVTRPDANVCSEQLWIPQLGVQAELKANGVTSVDVPASKAGNYQMTCQMGMLSGTLQVGGGASKSPNPVPAMLLVGAGLLGWSYWSRKRKAEAPTPAPTGAGKGGRSGAAGGSSGGMRGARPAPVGPDIFGFTPAEAMLGCGAIVAAIIAGLAFGGLLR